MSTKFLDSTGLSYFWGKIKAFFASKVSGATNGNFAGLDSSGNLTDSGHKHGDYVTALGTNGDSLTYTKNGTANNVTVPFATKASKLGTSTVGSAHRPIYLNSGTATQITDVASDYIGWAANDHMGLSAIEALFNGTGNNALAFLKANKVDVEYTNDGGTTWLDYGMTANEKLQLFSTTGTARLGKKIPTSENPITTNDAVRITVHEGCGVYMQCNFIIMQISCPGATDLKIEYTTFADTTTYQTFKTYRANGSPVWVAIPIGKFLFGNNQWHDFRISAQYVGPTYPTNPYTITCIKAFGPNVYSSNSNMGKTGHLYGYDELGNATFPANLTAAKLIKTGGTSSEVLLANGETATLSSLQNVKPDWEAVSGSAAEILNEPAIRKGGDAIGSIIEGDLSTNISKANYSHAEGSATVAAEKYSHAEGLQTSAFGGQSHAEGKGVKYNVQITGPVSGTTDTYTVTCSDNPYELRKYDKIIYPADLSTGSSHTVIDISGSTSGSTAKLETSISGSVSGASAYLVRGFTAGNSSHSEGDLTVACGTSSHSEGYLTSAVGNQAHAEGYDTTALNTAEHAEGHSNVSHTGSTSAEKTIHSIGIGTTSNPKNAVEVMDNGDMYVYGVGTYDGTNYSSATKLQDVIGNINTAIGTIPTVDSALSSTSTNPVQNKVINTALSGKVPTSRKINNKSLTADITLTASDVGALPDSTVIPTVGTLNTNIIEAQPTDSSESLSGTVKLHKVSKTGKYGDLIDAPAIKKGTGTSAIIEGMIESNTDLNVASGNYSHAEGYGTKATSYQAHSEGYKTTASGSHSHSEGSNTSAAGNDSHAEGLFTETKNASEHAEGEYNLSSNGSSNATKTIHSVGIGTSSSARKNALDIRRNGDVYIDRVGNYNGTGTVRTLQQVLANLESADANFVKYDDVLQPTNPFGGKKLYINSVDDAFYAADKRFWVKVTTHLKTVNGVQYPYEDESKPVTDPNRFVDSPVVQELSAANLFNGSYENTVVCPVTHYMKVHIQFAPFSDSWDPSTTTAQFLGYPYGSYYLNYYNTNIPPRRSQVRIYNNHTGGGGKGWKLLDATVYSINEAQTGNLIEELSNSSWYGRTCVEFIIYGNDSGNNVSLTQIDYKLIRPDIARDGSTVNKYGKQSLYYDFEWYNHINDSALDKTISLSASTGEITANKFKTKNGSSSQFVKGDGSLDSNSYTKKVSSSTDNAVVRFDGTQGDIQNSGVTINDSNHITATKFIKTGGDGTNVLLDNGNTALLSNLTNGVLDTTQTSPQQTSSNESFGGTVKLHKVSKTGSYNDLGDKPTIPTVPTLTGGDGISVTGTSSKTIAVDLASSPGGLGFSSGKLLMNAASGSAAGYMSNTDFNKINAQSITATSSSPADLNTYTTVGTYITSGGQNGSSVQVNTLNTPTGSAGAFMLVVLRTSSDNSITLRKQIYIQANGKVWSREYNSSTWSTWQEWDFSSQVQSNWNEDDDNSKAHVLNRPNVRKGTAATAVVEGNIASNIASGSYSHAEGANTKAVGNWSHAEGYNTKVYAQYSHAEGYGVTATGDGASHAEGFHNPSSANDGDVSIAGITGTGDHDQSSTTTFTYTATSTEALEVGDVLRSEVNSTTYHAVVRQIKSTTEFTTYSTLGALNNATITKVRGVAGTNAHCEGRATVASGNRSHAEGYMTKAFGTNAHVEGNACKTMSNNSHAEGDSTKASNTAAHAEGNGTTASGASSHSEGSSTTASGASSHAEGSSTTSSGQYSHAEGYNTVASGYHSHAEGSGTTASGGSENYPSSHAEGLGTVASSGASHAEGYYATAAAFGSHAEGCYTQTTSGNNYEHAQGKYNSSRTGSTDADKTIHSIGIGTGNTARKNAVEVMLNGDVYIDRVGNYNGSGTVKSLQTVLSEINTAATTKPDWEATAGSAAEILNEPNIRIGLSGSTKVQTAIVEGNLSNVAKGAYSHAEGDSTKALNSSAHAEGTGTTANGSHSHAEGYGTSTTISGVTGPVSGQANYTYNTTSAHGLAVYDIVSSDQGHTIVTAVGSTTSFTTYATLGTLSSGTVTKKTGYAHSYAHTEGRNSVAWGGTSHSEGYGSKAIGSYSHAEGYMTSAIGGRTHNAANSTFGSSHAEGALTKAIGDASHAEGYSSTASGYTSHAEGYDTKAEGVYGAHSEGIRSSASGDYSHAEGQCTWALGNGSHTESYFTSAPDYRGHAEGAGSRYVSSGTKPGWANDWPSSVSWNQYTASGSGPSYTTTAAHNLVVGDVIMWELNGTKKFYPVTAVTSTSFTIPTADSYDTLPSGTVVTKMRGVAFGQQSHSEGDNCNAIGKSSHAEGSSSKSMGTASHAEGYNSLVSSDYSHAEGRSTTASGSNGAHAEGYSTTASGSAAHAEGYASVASATYSHAEGGATEATNNYEHAEGRYNKSNKKNTSWGAGGNTIHSIGIGTSNNNRKNAFEVMQSGDVYVYGIGNYNGQNPNTTGVLSLKDAIDGIIDEIADADGKYLSIHGGQLVPNGTNQTYITGLPNQLPSSSVSGYNTYALSIGMANSLYLSTSGGDMDGDIDMNGNFISHLEDPIDDQDAATKRYVDSVAGNSWSTIITNVSRLVGTQSVIWAYAAPRSMATLGFAGTAMVPNTTCHIFVLGNNSNSVAFNSSDLTIPYNIECGDVSDGTNTVIIDNVVYMSDGNEINRNSPSYTIPQNGILEISVMFQKLTIGGSKKYMTIIKTGQ